MYLLDTNHCSRVLKNHPTAILKLSEPNLELSTCVIVQGELIFMVENSDKKEENFIRVSQFLNDLQIHKISNDVAKIYGKIKAHLYEHFGPTKKAAKRNFNLKKIGVYDNDLWIASVAIHHNLILLTSDKDFDKIKEVSTNLQTNSWF